MWRRSKVSGFAVEQTQSVGVYAKEMPDTIKLPDKQLRLKVHRTYYMNHIALRGIFQCLLVTEEWCVDHCRKSRKGGRNVH